MNNKEISIVVEEVGRFSIENLVPGRWLEERYSVFVFGSASRTARKEHFCDRKRVP